MLVPLPMVMGALSPRSTAPKNTLLRSPSVTSPRTVALSATKAEEEMVGFFMGSTSLQKFLLILSHLSEKIDNQIEFCAYIFRQHVV